MKSRNFRFQISKNNFFFLFVLSSFQIKPVNFVHFNLISDFEKYSTNSRFCIVTTLPRNNSGGLPYTSGARVYTSLDILRTRVVDKNYSPEQYEILQASLWNRQNKHSALNTAKVTTIMAFHRYAIVVMWYYIRPNVYYVNTHIGANHYCLRIIVDSSLT